MDTYQKSIKEISEEGKTDIEKGLTEDDAANRYQLYGPNILIQEIATEPFIIIFFKQFRNSLIYILLLSAALIFFSGEILDACIVSGILLFNAILGTIQEGKAQKILKGLQHYSKPSAVVIRNGKEQIIPVENIVLGDLIVIQAGEKIPADARLVQAYNLQVDESMLTGESESITKNTSIIQQKVTIADQKNMVFKGTYVLQGDGAGIVVATGSNTQIGLLKKITEEEIRSDFPLKKKLDQLSRWIVLIAFFQCIFLLLLSVVMGKTFIESLIFLTALFICVIPEGLPLVFTLTLVAGAQRMARKNVLIKKLQAVEGLGTTDVIITDKTGTLTRNEMLATNIFVNNKFFTITGQGYFPQGSLLHNSQIIQPDTSLIDLAKACKLLNRSVIQYDEKQKLFRIKGEPMDAALEILSKKITDFPSLEKEYKKFYELPFDPKTRTRANFYYHNTNVIAFILGSPTTILQSCKQKTTETDNAIQNFFNLGLRTTALAYKTSSISEFNNEKSDTSAFYQNWISHDLHLLGIIGIQDTIRSDVEHVVEDSRNAGLKVIMATGDHLDTALLVAKKVSIFQSGDVALNGLELDALADSDLIAKLNKTTVFSRVTPEQKLRIVKTYQKTNNIVAMTGDGINDAPALVAANLGIAMGNIGTEVAKQAADIILLDDSFSAIIDAIKEGRHIFFTLYKVTLYFFTTNIAEILLVLFTFIVNLPLPLFPAQILWLNLITDGFLNVSLVSEPEEQNLLYAKINKQQQLLDIKTFLKILYMSLPMAFGSLGMFYYYLNDLRLARTMAFTTMAMFQWFNIWNCRSEKESVFTIGLLSNPLLLLTCCIVLILQITIIYLPLMQNIFKTVPLSYNQWLTIFLLSSTVVLLEEIRKKQFNHKIIKYFRLYKKPLKK